MRFFTTALCSVALALVAYPCLGADSSTAELLFQKGRAAMVAQDFPAACQHFSESLELDPAVGTLMNLAACEQRLGRYATSYGYWQDALTQLEDDDPRRGFAAEQAAEADEQAAQLTIQVGPNTPKPVTILWDGVELKKSDIGKELRADPGAHLIVVQSKTHEEKRYHFPLDPAQSTSMIVTVGAPLPRAGTAASKSEFRVQRIAGYSSLGLGAVGIVGLIVTGVLLPEAKDELDELCPQKTCTTSEGLDKRDSAKTLLALNTASWVVAGVAVAAGTTLLLTLPLTKERSPGAGPRAPRKGSDARAPLQLELAVRPTQLELIGTF